MKYYILVPLALFVGLSPASGPALAGHPSLVVMPTARLRPNEFPNVAQGPLGLPFVVEPAPRARVAPTLPPDELQRNISGSVRVAIAIGQSGKVTDCRILESIPTSAFGEAASAAIKRWVFVPTTRRGKAIAVETDFTITFGISDN